MGYSLIQWSVMADRNYGKMQSKKKTPAKIPLYQIQYVNVSYERRSDERKRGNKTCYAIEAINRISNTIKGPTLTLEATFICNHFPFQSTAWQLRHTLLSFGRLNVERKIEEKKYVHAHDRFIYSHVCLCVFTNKLVKLEDLWERFSNFGIYAHNMIVEWSAEEFWRKKK